MSAFLISLSSHISILIVPPIFPQTPHWVRTSKIWFLPSCGFGSNVGVSHKYPKNPWFWEKYLFIDKCLKNVSMRRWEWGWGYYQLGGFPPAISIWHQSETPMGQPRLGGGWRHWYGDGGRAIVTKKKSVNMFKSKLFLCSPEPKAKSLWGFQIELLGPDCQLAVCNPIAWHFCFPHKK